ncbi:DUF4921 family protein [Propionibacteriaceae bacterium G57]|uniref:DUF4921 family protein n=1 Tax=Aestuariimicrobium sp. G57 TaxID=3418485 RepID=UPI003DA73D58
MRSPHADLLIRLADGTIKQRNPISDNEVWTVPGRGNRPLAPQLPDPVPLAASRHGDFCAFCQKRYLETPPEQVRLVRTGRPGEDGDDWQQLHRLPADKVFDTVAEFRCVPNLFEILSYDYWHLNHGYELTPVDAQHRADYLADAAGRAHVLAIARTKLRAAGRTDDEIAGMGDEAMLAQTTGFFGGGHDLIVARRHYVDGAKYSSELASSGTLSVEEHRHYIALTVAQLDYLYRSNPFAKYVAVFQNWLKPAGASFDHLHKQLVAIDSQGARNEKVIRLLTEHPTAYQDRLLRPAREFGLVIARNDHAVAFAGFGHRFPTIEVFSTSPTCAPQQQTADEVAAMSDLVHAVHAATGPHVPANEEWHYRPRGTTVNIPWHINIKWRISTLAGFEGGTKIYLNTIDPWTIRDRVVARLHELQAVGAIAPMTISG